MSLQACIVREFDATEIACRPLLTNYWLTACQRTASVHLHRGEHLEKRNRFSLLDFFLHLLFVTHALIESGLLEDDYWVRNGRAVNHVALDLNKQVITPQIHIYSLPSISDFCEVIELDVLCL
jgi:hypothetical protein